MSLALPRSLSRKTLAEAEIGARTGLNVIALQENGQIVTHHTAGVGKIDRAALPLPRVESSDSVDETDDAVASVAEYKINPRLDAPATPERVLLAVERMRAEAKTQ